MRLALILTIVTLSACTSPWGECGCTEEGQLCIATDGTDEPMSGFDPDVSSCEAIPDACVDGFPADGGKTDLSDECLLELCGCTMDESCGYVVEYDGLGGWFFSCQDVG